MYLCPFFLAFMEPAEKLEYCFTFIVRECAAWLLYVWKLPGCNLFDICDEICLLSNRRVIKTLESVLPPSHVVSVAGKRKWRRKKRPPWICSGSLLLSLGRSLTNTHLGLLRLNQRCSPSQHFYSQLGSQRWISFLDFIPFLIKDRRLCSFYCFRTSVFYSGGILEQVAHLVWGRFFFFFGINNAFTRVFIVMGYILQDHLGISLK